MTFNRISDSGTGTRTAVMLGAGAAVFLCIVGLSYREWRQYNRANEEAAQTREIVDSVDRLLSDLIDAQSGQRGYLLTGENRYLEPYNRAVRAIPNDLSAISSSLGTRPNQAGNVARLNDLSAQRLAELQQTIALRQIGAAESALAAVLSDQGKPTMDQIRTLCAQIRRTEISGHSQASAEGEAAAGTALLAAIVLSIVLLFLFAFGLQPFASPEPEAWQRPWPLRYGAAVAVVILVALLREALTPLIGRTNLPFTLFFCAVAFAAWFGGFRPAVLSIVLSLLAGAYFFAAPTGTLHVSGRDDQVAMLLIVVVGFGVALLSRSQRGAVDRALRAENSERNERLRYQTTLSSIGDAVITTGADGRITLLNDVAQAVTGWTQHEAAGKPLEHVFVVRNEDTGDDVENPVNKVLREGRTVGLANHSELIAKNGRHVPIDDSAAPIRNADGKIGGVVLVFRDISGRKKAEQDILRGLEELRLSNTALVRANEDLNQFAFAASHDLQEPLRMITSYSQLLVKGYSGQLDGEAGTCIKFITDGTRRMRELLSDLLAYTRVTADGERQIETVDLNRVLETTLANCKTAIEETGASITADRLPKVLGHEPHFVQIFQNLISNSLKYRSDCPPQVRISAERQDSFIRVAVKDNGIGIAPEYHRQVFGVFKRLHGRAIPGTGIGLAICQRVVHRYGGEIWVDSDGNDGSTFYFTLPAAEKEAAAYER